MDFKLATVNSLFDGVSVENLNAATWIRLHLSVFIGNQKMLRKLRAQRKKPHPVAQVLDAHDPDIIVVNEVIQSDRESETIKLLKKKGFQGVELDAVVEVTDKFKRGTLVASRFSAESIPVDVQRFPGGRFSALRIPELNLIVIGVQATPFNWLIRKYQVRSILSHFEKWDKKGYKVIVAGDFNMGIRHSGLKLPKDVGHYTERTFPGPAFYEMICSEKSLAAEFMRTLLKVRKAPRSLDHILYSKSNLKLTEGTPIETVSDHCALAAGFKA